MAADEEQQRSLPREDEIPRDANENVSLESRINSSPTLDRTPTKTKMAIPATVFNENSPAAPAYWSPRYEFDAPRFINFAKTKYDETRCLLNKIVLQADEPSKTAAAPRHPQAEPRTAGNGSGEEDNEDFLAFLMQSQLEAGDTSDLEGDVWFLRFHPLHEPLRPQTPPGPLITPEKPLPIEGSRTCRSLANILAMSPSSPSRSSSTLLPLSLSPTRSSPSKSSPRMVRSPAAFTVARGHVSASSNAGSSFSSSANGSPSVGAPASPVRVLGLKARPARILRPNEHASERTNVNVPGPDYAALDGSPLARLPKSPLKQSYTSSTLKRSSSHLGAEGRASVGDLGQRLDTHLMIKSRLDSPEGTTHKRTKQETVHDRTAQLAKKHSEPHANPTAGTRTSRRTNNADLNDIKKLLSQHNSRLKPKR